MHRPSIHDFRTQKAETVPETDASLVTRIKNGEQSAVKELFGRYFTGLCRFTFRLVRSEEDVEDIVLTVFEKLWINRERLEPSKSIKSYLFKAANNQAIDFLRMKEKKPIASGFEKLQPESDSDPVQDVINADFSTAFRRAVERLPKKCKLIFVLSREEGLSYSEIAASLDLSEKTVKNQIVKALKHLRKDLRAFIG